MLRKFSALFLHQYRVHDASFFFRRHLNKDELYPVFSKEISGERRKSFHVLDHGKVFAKTTQLKNLTAKLRVSLMLSRGAKGYDYPLADLINSINAEVSGVLTPKLIGFGYQSRFGLVSKIALFYEHLQNYSDGIVWLKKYPEKAIELTKKVHNKFIQMHSFKCYHLDIWLGNVMVPVDLSDDIQLIDFEQYVSGVPGNTESLLGFIFGYFYSRELNRILSEADYDALSYNALTTVCDIQSPVFQRVYQLSKQGRINRQLRRQFFTHQSLPVV